MLDLFQLFQLRIVPIIFTFPGDLKVPSSDEMMADIATRQDEESKISSLLAAFDYQTKYVNELSELLGKVSVDSSELIRRWLSDRDEDVSTYREKTHFKSNYR